MRRRDDKGLAIYPFTSPPQWLTLPLLMGYINTFTVPTSRMVVFISTYLPGILTGHGSDCYYYY
jgi:hypothetical protein